MVDFLTLARTDYTDVASKVDLLGGGLRLVRGSWLPKAGSGGPVTDTFDLVGVGDNAAIIDEIGRLEDLLELARTWPENPVQADGVWLEWGVDGEPRVSAESGYASKRSWVYGGELQVMAPRGLPGPLMDTKMAARLAITRHSVWENLEPVSDTFAAISWGDATDLTVMTEGGTLPSRIQQALVNYASANTIQEWWVGIRPAGQGFAEFEPLWELEDGTNGTDAADDTDAGSSDNGHVEVDFSTETGLDERCSISTNQAHPGTTDWEDFKGRYLVLVRAKVGSSTECGLVLYHGGVYSASQRPCEEVYIDNENWMLIELGEVTIPPAGFRDEYDLGNEAATQYFTMAIHAERLSGSGSLFLDCLYLVPTDHFAHGIYAPADVSGCRMAIFTDPADGQTARMLLYATNYMLNGETTLRNWELPVDLGCAVVVGQDYDEHDMADTMELNLEWFPRWRLYRGV